MQSLNLFRNESFEHEGILPSITLNVDTIEGERNSKNPFVISSPETLCINWIGTELSNWTKLILDNGS